MKDDTNENAAGSARTVLAKTSICEITNEGGRVTLQLGRVKILLNAVELAALSGSCRSATRVLFPRRERSEVLSAPFLRLVPDITEGGE